MFCDTHCHIFKQYYENIDEIIKRANDNKVNRFIVAADNYNSSLEVSYQNIPKSGSFCLSIEFAITSMALFVCISSLIIFII